MTPKEILAQVSRPEQWNGKIITHSGKAFSPLYPRVEDVDLNDIAWSLAHTLRYKGHIQPAVSVAEHSILVKDIIERLWPESGMAVCGLLHDACEAYTQDIPSPIRRMAFIKREGFFLPWGEFDDLVNAVICQKIGIDPADLASPEVKAADLLAAAIEKRDSQNFKDAPSWGLPPIPNELAGLGLQFWEPIVAAQKISGQFHLFGLMKHELA